MLGNGKIEIREIIPSVSDYQNLRKSAGWYCTDDETAEKGLASSLYSLCALEDDQVVGCGRIVGDGHLYFYIQDVIVLPEFREQGIGQEVTKLLMCYIEQHAPHNSFIGLMAANGVEGFYEKFGFIRRPKNAPGMFLLKKDPI